MATHRTVVQRVTRLENETESVYELVGKLRFTQQRHTRRFDRIDARLDAMDTRFDRIDTRLDAMDTRFDGIDTRLDRIDSTLVEILRRLPEPA